MRARGTGRSPAVAPMRLSRFALAYFFPAMGRSFADRRRVTQTYRWLKFFKGNISQEVGRDMRLGEGRGHMAHKVKTIIRNMLDASGKRFWAGR